MRRLQPNQKPSFHSGWSKALLLVAMRASISIYSLLICLASGSLLANTINVPSNYSTIQAAIDAAQAGDTILVQPGTYIENRDFNGKNITVGSLNLTTGARSYIAQTIIDGGGAGRVVTIENGEDSTAVLCELTLANGERNFGGGVHCSRSGPTLKNLVVEGNSSSSGGAGMFMEYSIPTLSGITIRNNTAFRGAGIFFDSSSAKFDLVERSNIYSSHGGSRGPELFSRDTMMIQVSVDTFSVVYPINANVFPGDRSELDILNANTEPGSIFLEKIGEIYAESSDSGYAALTDSLVSYARSVGIPVIEDSTVYFFYRGPAQSVWVELAGDDIFFMEKLSVTDLFFVPRTFEMDARLEYIFIIDSEDRLFDPENSIVSYANVRANELAMPNYVFPEEVEYDTTIAHGTMDTVAIFSSALSDPPLDNVSEFSSALGDIYDVMIYLPPGYDSNPSQFYPSLYFHDGQLVAMDDFGPLQNVLDYMIHHGAIDGIIAVFIPSKRFSRSATYAFEDRLIYEDFVANDVVSFIDSEYRTIVNPKARGMGGMSFGGLISTQIAYNNPDVFGLVAAYSPSYWAQNRLVYNSVVDFVRKDLKFYLDWGTYERVISGNAISFRDRIIDLGYEVEWNEWHEGHSGGSWRAHLDNALEFLYPIGFLHTVHSGDTDNNGVVDELDVLPIGIHFLNTGYRRDSTSYAWDDQGGYNWAWEDPAATYADANGDGTVDERDVIGIGVNWGNSHSAATSLIAIDPEDQSLLSEHRPAFETIYKSLKGEGNAAKKMRALLRAILEIPVPASYALEQNYPNPFNPSTTIRFGLPEDQYVTLTVYDLLGRAVAIPVNKKYFSAGSHTVIFDATDLSSGVYFYRVKSGPWAATRKLVVIK